MRDYFSGKRVIFRIYAACCSNAAALALILEMLRPLSGGERLEIEKLNFGAENAMEKMFNGTFK